MDTYNGGGFRALLKRLGGKGLPALQGDLYKVCVSVLTSSDLKGDRGPGSFPG